MKKILVIFAYMFKMGCFTFGGGWSIITQMQREFVEKKHWITDEQLIDFTSLGRSFPGIMVINITVMFGYSIYGVPGAIAAALGLSLPAVICIGIVTYFYTALRDNIYVSKIMNGVRAAVIPIILTAGIKLWSKAMVSKVSYITASIALLLCVFTNINKIFVVLCGVLIGLIMWKWRQKHDIF